MSSLFPGVDWPQLPNLAQLAAASGPSDLGGWNRKQQPTKSSLQLFQFPRRLQASKKARRELEELYDSMLAGYSLDKLETGEIMRYFVTYADVFEGLGLETAVHQDTIDKLLFFYQEYAKSLLDQERISTACFMFCVAVANSLRDYNEEGGKLGNSSSLAKMARFHSNHIPTDYKNTREYEDFIYDFGKVNVHI